MRICFECAAPLDESAAWACPACGRRPAEIGGFPFFGASEHPESPAEYDGPMYDRMVKMEARSFYFQARRKMVMWLLRRHFPDMTRYLDFGCGTGFLFESVRRARPGLEAWGCDLAPESLAAAQARFEDPQNLFLAKAEDLPFRDYFDAVGAFDVMEHIKDDEAALAALHSAVKPGGGAVLCAPQHMVLWSRLDEEVGHHRRYTGRGLAETARRAGFDIEFDGSFMASLFLPQYLARRFMRGAPGETSKLEEETNLPGPLNFAFRAVLEAEFTAVKAGLRPPFGGTRYVVGRRR